jgi:biofilm PGA synthesis lipoprotein PgaB
MWPSGKNSSPAFRAGIRFSLLAVICLAAFPAVPEAPGEAFLVLCYHDILPEPAAASDVSRKMFMRQIEFMRTHGYRFIGPEEIIQAEKGLKPLPEKAVLLTFDDAYLSFYQFVLPVLSTYGYPAVLSVVPSWIDERPGDLSGKKLMSWDQLRRAAESGLVHFAAHTDALHRGISYTPQGNVGPASSCFIWHAGHRRYETAEAFSARIRADLAACTKKMAKELGVAPRIVTWPYGEYNRLARKEAEDLGFRLQLTLRDGRASAHRPHGINRNAVTSEMSLRWFTSEGLQTAFVEKMLLRAVQVDLDLIVNPSSYEESDRNLGLLLDRLVRLGVNTVFLEACSDAEEAGTVRAAYFKNPVLPLRMDFFAHAVHRMKTRGLKVFARLPVLSFELKDEALNSDLEVRNGADGGPDTGRARYRRLSPFDSRTRKVIQLIYESLAARAQISGVLFQDDAYLSEMEDTGPAALAYCEERLGTVFSPETAAKDPSLKNRWTAIKMEVLNRFVGTLMDAVRVYRPNALFARDVHPQVLYDPGAFSRFSQSLPDFLRAYDFTVVMAYPGLAGADGGNQWLEALVEKAGQYPAGLEKCIFKIQSYDWERGVWLGDKQVKKGLRVLVAAGAKHIAYDPDSFEDDRPAVDHMISIMTSKYFPFEDRKRGY